MTAVSQAPPATSAEPAVAPPPGNPRFPLVDGLRAVAAISVLVFHAAYFSGDLDAAWWGDVAGRLEIGVAIFFVISGFLLYRPFFAAHRAGRAGPRARDFYRRRVLRIVPAYWLALTALAVYPGLRGVFDGDWWVYYGFAQIYDRETFGGGIPQAWTLCVEATFYLALPFYAGALRRIGDALGGARRVAIELGVLALLAGACLVLRVVVIGSSDSLLPYTLPGLFDWFATGMALAVLSVWLAERERGPRWARLVAERPSLCWAGAAGVFGLLVLAGPPPSLVRPYSELEFHAINVLSPIVGVLLILPAVVGDSRGGAVRRFLGMPAVAWLGLVSYGIYLWQAAVLEWLVGRGLDDVLPVGDLPLLVAVGLGLTTACAAASYYLVERPILRFKDRRRGRRAG